MKNIILFVLIALISSCSTPEKLLKPEPLPSTVAIKAQILHFTADPFTTPEEKSFSFIEKGILLIRDGRVVSVGSDVSVIPGDAAVYDFSNQLVVPGFIDTHVHMPQIEIAAANGETAADVRTRYTYPTEKQYANKEHAQKIAKFFLSELLKNGTTTAAVFTTIHPQATDAFFEEAEKLGLRMIAGRVMMDNPIATPPDLRDTADSSYLDTKALISRWNGKDRLLYAVTPRSIGTSTSTQLRYAGQLLKEFPNVYLQTHLSEKELEVFDQYGLVTSKSIFVHGLQVTETELKRLSSAGSSLAFCPLSEVALGNGLFKLHAALDTKRPVKVGLGSDVGAGASLSMLTTISEAYKVQQLQKQRITPLKGLYLATLGGAKALSLEDKIGNFETGKEADFVVLDLEVTELQKLRSQNLRNIADRIFGTIMLGDERNVRATFAVGKVVYQREAVKPFTPGSERPAVLKAF